MLVPGLPSPRVGNPLLMNYKGILVASRIDRITRSDRTGYYACPRPQLILGGVEAFAYTYSNGVCEERPGSLFAREKSI